MRRIVPTAAEVRGTFYVAGLCTVALIATICWGIVHKVNESDDVLHIAVSQSDQVRRLNEQLDAQGAALDAQGAAAAAARTQLKDEVKALRHQQRALFRYLHQQGVKIPPSALTPRRSEGRTPDPKAPATSSGPSPHPHPSTPGSPGSTATPTPTPSPTTGGIDLTQVCALLHLYPCPLT